MTLRVSPKVGKVRSEFKRGRKSIAAFDIEDLFDDYTMGEDQVPLTEAELKQEITRVLTAENPQIDTNLVVFSHKELTFKPVIVTEHLLVHLDIPNKLVHKSQLEAKPLHSPAPSKKVSVDLKVERGEGEGDELREGDEEAEEKPPTEVPSQEELKEEDEAGKKLTNKFNYSERAAQTYNNPTRTREIQTIPPPRATLTGSVTQWEIYDAYVQYQELQEKAKAKAPTKKTKKTYVTEIAVNELVKMTTATKTVERMINQNIFDEISQDFKYFEDASDEYRDKEGTLLPLWKFVHEEAKSLAVTSLSWNTKYHDLFTAGYGSYEYSKQQKGLICAFTLKNPSYPEFFYVMDSGILSVDTHPNHQYLVVAGYYDGTVAVFNFKEPKKEPVYLCDLKEGKHNAPVWQVKWQPNNLDGNLNFVSVSSDGRVTNWVLLKTDVIFSNMINLNLDEQLEGPEGTHLNIKGCGTSIAFHREKDSIFLIGTEEGFVYRCSTAYTNQFLMTYAGHSLAVYKIQWNYYHPDIFITCSADWTVKLWDYKEPKPLFIFDFGCAIGDVTWSPYASTVFAAAGANGKVYLFDLHVNKYNWICEQIVVQKRNTKLTCLAFNRTYPVLLAGDNRGCITCLKLSPNLRRVFKDNRNLDAIKYAETEVTKLNKILAVVRQMKK